MIIFLLSLVLSLSPVQTKLASYLTEYLSDNYDAKISLSKVDLSVFGKINLEGIVVYDHKADTMVYLSNLRGNMDKLDLVSGKVKVDDLFLIKPYLGIKIYEEDTASNLNIFIKKFDSGDSTKSNLDFSSAGVNIKDLTLDLQDRRVSKEKNLHLYNLDLVVRDIEVKSTNVKFDVDEFIFKTKRGFRMRKFSGGFEYSPTSVSIDNFEMQTNNSHLYSTLKITYPDIDHLLKASPNVKIDLQIDESNVSFKDVNYFYKLNNSNDKVDVRLKARGNLDHLVVRELELKSANNTEIDAKLDLKNITSKDKYNYYVSFNRLSSNYKDLVNILPKRFEKVVPPLVENLGDFELKGNTELSKTMFYSNVEFNSEVGKLSSELDVALKENFQESSYKGQISIEDFNLKEFTKINNLGYASLSLSVEGEGFDLEHLNTHVEGEVSSLDFKKYRYSNINIDGDIKKRKFFGEVDVKDKYLDVQFKGLVDNSTKVPRYDFDLYIDKADLKSTNLFTRDSISFLEGNISINLKGNRFDNFEGILDINNVVYQNESNLYYFEEFTVKSNRNKQYQRIDIESDDVVSGIIEGDFYLDDLPALFKNAIGSNFENYQAEKIRKEQELRFDLEFKNKIIEVFYPKVDLGRGTKLTGNVNSSQNKLELKFDSPKARVDEVIIDSISLWIDNKNPFVNTLLTVGKIDNKAYPINNLNLAIKTKKDSVYITTNFEGGDTLSEKYQIRAYQTFDENAELVVGLLKSEIDFKDEKYFINHNGDHNNRIIYNLESRDYTIDSIFVATLQNYKVADSIGVYSDSILYFNDSTYIAKHIDHTDSLMFKNYYNDLDSLQLANGFIVKDSIYTYRDSIVKSALVYGVKRENIEGYDAILKNFKLEDIVPENSKISASGILNANIQVDYDQGEYKPIVNLTVDTLFINKDYIGDVNMNMINSEVDRVFNSDVRITRRDIESISVKGKIDLRKSTPEVDLDLSMEKFKLKFLNVFTDKIFNNIRGYASGVVNISGPVANPKLNGYLDLYRAGIGINYLNVDYNISGGERIFIEDHLITIPEVDIRDSKLGTKGLFSGTITNSSGYKEWNMDLNIKADNLLALNTTVDDNPMFYGKVFCSGDVRIFGPTSALGFDIKARTEKGTVFSIPLQSRGLDGENSLVQFVPPKKEIKEEVDEFGEVIELYEVDVVQNQLEEDFFKGLKLSFNLEVTEDALAEIVLDEQVGDIMRGRGEGNFRIDIDTKGEFSIRGAYVIHNGEYLFTLQNLINKKFSVSDGGTITWSGNPTDAILDINAVYKTKTTAASYLDMTTSDGGSGSRMLVELLLNLRGPLMEPELAFDVKMPDADPSIQANLEMKLNESDEERSRQFITLITLNSFASSDSDIAIGSSVANTTAELVANQFSNIASGISDNVDVNVGYNTADPSQAINSNNARYNSDELEVGVSSQLFDDRVTVNGNVGVPVGSSQSSIVGDVEVLVNITKDGRYKGKVFTRQNVVTDMFESTGYTQGVGISYQTNFDTFSEFIDNLLRRKNRKKVEEKKEDEEAIKALNDSTTVNFQ